MRKYHLGPTIDERPFPGAEFTVRIADDLRKATVFLGDEIADDGGNPDIDAQGTGFFIGWQSDLGRPRHMEPEIPGIYLVTARHVARPLGKDFAIRFNKKDGSSDIERIRNATWHFHADATVDVAVLHCGHPDWSDCIPIPGRLLAKPALLPHELDPTQAVTWASKEDLIFNNPNIGIGDIAYVVGLFHFVKGKKRNLSVVHTGHIALLPDDEKIPVSNELTGELDQVEAYLVEAHGLEGLSGAPVFARCSAPVTAPYRHEGPPLAGGHKLQHPVAGRIHSQVVLLGLWQASWSGEPDKVLAEDKNLKNRKVPIGMGVVVPASKIAEVLNKEALVKSRQNEYKRRLNENAATTDSLSPSGDSAPDSDANPNHLADFTRLVDVAARKRPQDD